MPKDRITIMIEGDTLREVDRWAKLVRRSRSDMIGTALLEWLENARLGKAVLSCPSAMEGLLKVFSDRSVMRSMASALGEELSEKDFQQFEGLFAEIEKQQRKAKKKGKRGEPSGTASRAPRKAAVPRRKAKR